MRHSRDCTAYCPPAWQLGLLAAAMAVAVFFAITVAPPPVTPGPFWVARPITLAVLLSVPVVRWAMFLVTEFIVSLALASLLEMHGLVSVALINTAEVAVAAALLRRASDAWPGLADPLAFRRFLLIAVVALPAVASLPAALTISLRDHTPYFVTLQVRFLTDSIGMLVMAPAALAVLRGDVRRLIHTPGTARHAILLASVIATTIGVFVQSRYPLLFLIPPTLSLLAAQTGEPGLAFSMPLVAGLALYCTSMGSGPFWLKAGVEPAERMVLELAFVAACVAVGRISAASTAKHASAVDRLLEANDRLELAAASGGLGVWEWNVSTSRLTWDARMASLYGTRPETAPVHAGAWAERLLPRDRNTAERAFFRAFKDSTQLDTEFRIVRDDGEVRHIRAAGLLRRDTAGKPSNMIGISWDVTAYADALSALHESEEKLRLLIGGVRDHAVYLLDPEGRVASWNPGAERITGYSEADILGRNVDRLFTEQAAAAGDPARELANAAELGSWEGEGWRVRKDGSQFLARVVITARRDSDGTLRGFTKIAHDLSERKMQEAQRAIIIESAPAGMLLVDDDDVITLANSHAEALFGYPRGGLTGLPVAQLVAEDRRAAYPHLRQDYLRGIREGTSRFWQYDGQRKDGSLLSVEVLLKPIQTPHGNITVATVLDASERVRRKEERLRNEASERAEAAATQTRLEQLARHLARARDEAQQASEAKTRFLASITHELRTPLNGILGYAQLLRLEGGLSAHQDAHVAAMLSAGEHLVGMINAVLDLSQIETDRLELIPVPVALREFARSCLDLVRPAAQAKSLKLDLHIADGAPLELTADKTRLRQVLVNLLGNAVKFTPTGRVALRVLPGQPGHVRLEVADTGPGISDQQSKLLFQEFSRLPGDAVAAVEGSGLGLAITSRLVQRMGGNIGHAKNRCGGSVFWVELPAADRPIVATTILADARISPVTEPLSVLVVDDVETNRVIAAAMLRHAGHNVTLAEEGTAAVALAASQDFHVILMDVRMPGIDGLVATRQIRNLPSPRGDVPVVALTAQAFASQIERCYAAGMDDHVSKPLEHKALLAALMRATTKPRALRLGERVAEAVEEAEVDFDETQFLATRNLLPPPNFAKYLRAIASQCEALQYRLATPDALADIQSLVEEVHKAGGNAGGMGMIRLASVAKQFEHAAEVGLPDIERRAAELAGVLSTSAPKLAALASSVEMGSS